MDREIANALQKLEREIEFTEIIKCCIKTGNVKPIFKRGSFVPQSMEKEARKISKAI